MALILALTMVSLLVLVSVGPTWVTRVALPTWLPWSVAHRLTFFCATATEHVDPDGLAAYAAARAGAPPEAVEAWIRARRVECVRGAAVAAAGLAAWRRGDVDRARRLLASVSLLDERVVPSLVGRQVLEWRCAEAVSRGAWDEAASMDGGTFAGQFLVLAARRLVHRPDGPQDPDLQQAFLRAGRLGLYPLLRRALDAQPPAAASAAKLADPVSLALDQHLKARVGAGPLRSAVEDWDTVSRDPDVRVAIAGRAAALGVEGIDPLGRVVDDVTDDLAALVVERGGGVVGTGALASQVSDKARTALLAAVDGVVDPIGDRVDAGERRAALLEWEGALSVIEVVDRCAGVSLDVHRLAVSTSDPVLTKLAGVLYNELGERALGHGICLWQARRAERLGMPSERKRRNASLGPGV